MQLSNFKFQSCNRSTTSQTIEIESYKFLLNFKPIFFHYFLICLYFQKRIFSDKSKLCAIKN